MMMKQIISVVDRTESASRLSWSWYHYCYCCYFYTAACTDNVVMERKTYP